MDYDESGVVIGMVLVNVRHLLDRDGALQRKADPILGESVRLGVAVGPVMAVTWLPV